MRVKVKYKETYNRTHELTVDDGEFLEYLNEGQDPDERFESLDEAQANMADEWDDWLKDFLEDGDDWKRQEPPGPFDEVYDQDIDKVEVL